MARSHRPAYGGSRVEGGRSRWLNAQENDDLAPVVWMAFMAGMPATTVCSGVCSYARHELRLWFEYGPQSSARVWRVPRGGGAIHVGYTRKKNGHLAPLVWFACITRVRVMTVPSGV